MNMKIIQVISGGMDSVAMLYYLHNKHKNIKCLSINYNQKHKKEIAFASYHCKKLGIEHKVVDITSVASLFNKESVLINENNDVPNGHYENSEMKKTIVPNRNMLILAIATAWAIEEKYNAICYGAHSGDSVIYPDCRLEFVNAMQKAISLCDDHKINIITPFINKTKADIVEVGNKLKVNWQKTWTCYKGRELHCGMCATCIERREAFYLAGIKDPTIYDACLSVEELIKTNWSKK